MATLERVIQMKGQGISDAQIVSSLRQEGISPKEISESLSQSNIKMALTAEEPPIQMGNEEGQMDSSMQQSIMTQERPVDEEGYKDYSETSTAPAPVPTQAISPEQNPQAYPEYYPEYQAQYQEYQPPQSIDIETVNDIAEQLIEEKTEKLEKEIAAFTKFREEVQFDVQKMNERLMKVETKFDELQMAIIKKIGDYGKDISNISKEMHLTQESFSKVLDPLTDNIRALQEITGNNPMTKSDNRPVQQQEPEQTREPALRKQKTDFESYLR